MKDEVRYRFLRWLVFSSFILLSSSVSSAAPTQEQVLRSINQSVGETVDPTKALAVLFCVLAVVIVIVLLSHRRQRVIVPKVLNHPGKLLKEVARGINLRPAQVRQLKSAAEELEIDNPLVLLLCPSLLGAKKRDGKASDRATQSP